MKTNIYLYRREKPRTGAFKTWEYDYLPIEDTELPTTPRGFTLFTITKPVL